MIEEVPENKKTGVAAYTRIYDVRATQVEIMTLADDKGGTIVSCDDKTDYDTHHFKEGAGFVVPQFAPGWWQCYRSTDGMKFKKDGTLRRSAVGRLLEVTLCIDGQNLTDQLWYRWEKIA